MFLSEAIKIMTKLYIMYGDADLKISTPNEMGRLPIEHIGKPITIGKNNNCFLIIAKSEIITERE